MPASCTLIPRNRVRWIPRDLQLAHEFCFFLHDECARLLAEYERAEAHHLEIKFNSLEEAEAFNRLADEDTITTLRELGYGKEARRVLINNITMAMTADSLHHVYEALRCFEKRKVVVAFNLLRKPLTDNLTYLSWMLADEDAFYATFEAGQPEALLLSRIANNRSKIMADALARTVVAELLDPEDIRAAIFDRSWESGLQAYFQHAVHLVTAQYPELKTSPENFNFIFSSPPDDGYYEIAYEALPFVLLYFASVVIELFDRMHAMDGAAKRAFGVRVRIGLCLVLGGTVAQEMADDLFSSFEGMLGCPSCKAPMTPSVHNAARMALSDTLRCGTCHRVGPFPFSYIFDPGFMRGVNERLRQAFERMG